MKSKKEKILHWLTYFIYVLIAIYVFLKGIQTTNDSASYMGMSSMRSPIYPLLIKLFYFIGGNHNQVWLLCFQILFGALGVYIFCSFIHRFFKLEYWLTFLLSLFLLVPYFIFGKIANVVMTEAIAYPLFLITIRFLIESVFNRRMRTFVMYLFCCIPLIMTRGQFLFLYLISVIVIVYFLIFLKEKRKKLGRVILIFLSCIIFTNLAERTYNYILFHHFNKVSLVGLQLSAAGFYLSDHEDIKLFNDTTEIKLFERVQLITHTQNNWNLTYDKRTIGNSGFGYYQKVYNDIIWHAAYPEAKKLIPENDAFNDLSCWIFVNNLTKSVSIKLIRQHWKEFISMYATNVLYGLGYKHNSLLFIISLFVFIVLSFRFHNKYAVLFTLLLVLSLINVVLIALVEPTGEYRYLIYNDFLYITLIVIAVNNWITLLKKNQDTINPKVVSK
jgi:hypothetical protein